MSGLPPRKLSAEVLHLDDALLVANKPPGVLLGRSSETQVGLPALLARLRRLDDPEAWQPIQSFHEQVSGVVVYARGPAARKLLRRRLVEGEDRVVYLALVSGYVESDRDIDIPLRFDKRAGKLLASPRRGTPAHTRIRIVERVAGNTLLECAPAGERTDQVRAHLAAIGHPLTIDPRFGGGETVLLSAYKPNYRPSGRRSERPLIDRLTLHAARVTLRHPETEAVLEFAAPVARDIKATLTQLRRLT